MKRLYLFLMLSSVLGVSQLIWSAACFGQQIQVSNSGSHGGVTSLDGTYTFAGLVNGKNSYSFSKSYIANGCNGCWVSAAIQWDGTQWVQKTVSRGGGSGGCTFYCEYYPAGSVVRSNSLDQGIKPPCDGWSGGMTVTGDCAGAPIADLAPGGTSFCQGATMNVTWTNGTTLGTDNIFSVILSNGGGNFDSGVTVLGTLAGNTATSMSVVLPGSLESNEYYKIKLEASKAPTGSYTTISSKFTIGLTEYAETVSGPSKACVGQTVSLTTSSTYPSYRWFKDNTLITGANSQNYVINSIQETDQGYYKVQGVSADGCLTKNSGSKFVDVSEGPPMINYSISNINTCEGNTDSPLKIEMENEGAYTFQWKKGTEIVKTESVSSRTSSYIPALGWYSSNAGMYTVVASQTGCTSSTTSSEVTVTVDQPQSPPAVTPAGTNAGPVTFTATPGFRRYNLSKWDGTSFVVQSSQVANTFTISQSGRYAISGENYCGTTPLSNEVTVTTACDTPPTLSASSVNSLPSTLTAPAGFSYYYWYKWNGSSYTSIASTTSNTRVVNAYGQYAVKGSLSCGETTFSNAITIADPCAGETQKPVITSFPATVTANCGAAATWDVAATDNCTAGGSITYKYYITGGVSVGDAGNLQNGTGSGTVFAANAVVHLFAFDAASNKSDEAQITITVSSTAYQFSDISATSTCAGGTPSVSITLPALAEGTVVDVSYNVDNGAAAPATHTKTATVNAAHKAVFQTDNLAVTSTMYVREIKNHSTNTCAQTFTSANSVALTVNSCTNPTGIPTNGLIAWYPFNGNANDESGHNLHGTGTNVTLTPDRYGNAGKAYDFNGSTSFIEVADNETYFRSPSVSVACWVYTRSHNDLMSLVGKPLVPSWSNSWGIATDPGSGDGTFFGVIGHDLSGLISVSPSQPRVNEKWTHITLTFDDAANKVKFYIDGVKVDEKPYDQSMLYVNSPVIFGRDIENGSPALYLNGKLDDVAIYDRALTDSEIQSMACLSQNYVATVVSAESACENWPSTVSVTLPNMPSGSLVNVIYQIGSGSQVVKTATVDAAHLATFSTDNLSMADHNKVLTVVRIQDHQANTCGADLTGSNTVTLNVRTCNIESGVGSGKALSFDGNDDYVATGKYLIPRSGNFTIDFWVNARPASGFREFVSQGAEGDALFIGTSGSSGEIRCGDKWLSTGYILPVNKWTHLSLVKDGAGAKLYANGILVSSVAQFTVSSAGSLTAIARQYAPYQEYANATIDELRFWNVALGESEIRERMCLKIKNSDSKFGNLVAYYNFDQEDAAILTDVKSGYNGTLANGPAWVASGAPVGDASAFGYNSGSVSLTHPQGEGLTVSGTQGSPAGVHVYMVDDVPTNTSGITGLGDNDRYFGVHHFGGSSVTYQASYSYAGNPFVGASNESSLALFSRKNGESAAWAQTTATLNTTGKTMLATGMETEYMLGSSGNALPVTLSSFRARLGDADQVDLDWTTSSEKNASHYEIERSVNAKNWQKIGKVDAGADAVGIRNYQFADVLSQTGNPRNGAGEVLYYRLRMVDMDGTYAFSRIEAITLKYKSTLVVSPNPSADGVITIIYEGETPGIRLMDVSGKEIPTRITQASAGKLKLSPVNRMPGGLYMVVAATSGRESVTKLVLLGD